MVEKADYWSVLLWDYYLPQIQSGKPFYLAADQELIQALYSSNKACMSSANILQEFNDACLELMNRTSRRLSVKKVAFESIPGKIYSRVICLAVQQVLVVEQMLNDESYSELAYFPRYYYSLGLSSDRSNNNNPLGDDFFKIWDVLKNELNTIPGSSQQTVTFAPGTGRDVNRKLPFSQALFTRHDLTIIRRSTSELTSESTEEMILTTLYRIRWQLGSRARNLVMKSNNEIKQRLCQQVLYFLRSETRFSLMRRRSNTGTSHRGAFVARLGTEDFLDEVFRLYLDFGNGILTEEGVERALSIVIQDEQIVALMPHYDSYLEITASNPFMAGDSLLLIVARTHLLSITNVLSELYGASSFVTCKSNLTCEFVVLLSRSVPDSRICDALGLSQSAKDLAKIEFAGGLPADRRSNMYLIGYPPNGMKYLGITLAHNYTIQVNNSSISVGQFLGSLHFEEHFCLYSVCVNDDKTELKMSPVRMGTDLNASSFGYALENDKISPIPKLLATEQASLKGTTIKTKNISADPTVLPSIRSRDLVSLTSRGKRISLPKNNLELIAAAINSIGDDYAHLANLAIRQIKATKSVPLVAVTNGVVRRLLKY